jgi:hypothetical protein
MMILAIFAVVACVFVFAAQTEKRPIRYRY